MHELSIAHSLIELGMNTLKQAQITTPVYAVHVRLGRLSGVVPAALRSAFDIAAEGTPFRHSQLLIEIVPVHILCPNCGPVDLGDGIGYVCPHCASVAIDLLQGRELELSSIEIEDIEIEDPVEIEYT